MLQNTKLVVGKACLHHAFRKALLAATDPHSPSDTKIEARLRNVLEASEIYPTDDELSELIVLFGGMSLETGTIDRMIECLGNQPVGGRLSGVVADGNLETVVLALLGTSGLSPLRDLVTLVNCLLCPVGADWNHRMAAVEIDPLRCPEWPCPTLGDGA